MAKRNGSVSPSKLDSVGKSAHIKPTLADMFEVVVKLQEGQTLMIENQNSIKERLGRIEADVGNLKKELAELATREDHSEERISNLEGKVGWHFEKAQAIDFELARQEQYSRKSSVRILGVEETAGEDAEKKCIEVLQAEIGVELKPEDIDIVHRVGRKGVNGSTRPLLVKLMSHKFKSQIMRNKKAAKGVKIFEDLAYGVRQILNEIIQQKQALGVESVWTIDGKLRFKYVDNDRVFLINSHDDYMNLIRK